MKRKSTYIILILLFFGASAFVVLRYNGQLKNDDVAFYPLKERKGPLAQTPEWAATKTKAGELIRIVRETKTDIKSTLALITVYLQEARVTGDYTYYNEAALNYVNDVLEQDPKNFDAHTLKALIELSQHHFADAIETAGRANLINPYSAFVYGILVDGNIEMGDYKTAVASAEKMISIRPDLRSYSRVAYLREIHGDYTGAIEAMIAAVEAGLPGDEATEWARIQLAHLYELTGDLKTAEMHYTIALDERPGYAYALAGLGNIAMAEKDYAKAISLYQQADTSIIDYGFKEKLASLYILNNEKNKSKHTIESLINDFKKASNEGEASINHHADKELTYVYLLKDNSKAALKHALLEYNRRPDNIEVNEAVAWAYYKNNEVQKAIPYIQNALRTGSKNPELNCRAAAIYVKAGDKIKAKIMLQDALKNNPNIDVKLKEESEMLLKSIL